MNEIFSRPTDEQSEKWVKSDANMLELGLAQHSLGRLAVTDEALLDAIHNEMEVALESSQDTPERLNPDERVAEVFMHVFGDKMETYAQQMWDVTRPMLDSDRFADDHPQPVDFSQNEAIVQLRLNGVDVDDDLYARFLILPTNGQPMLAYSVRNANEVMGRVSRGARVYGEEASLHMRARIGYIFPKGEAGDAQMAAKLVELKALRRGNEYFQDASDDQKATVLQYLQQLEQGDPTFDTDPGAYWRPKHSETTASLTQFL